MITGALIGVVIIVHDSTMSGVGVGFVHPSSITALVGFITIEELLHREARDLRILSRYDCQSLKSTSGGKSPARPAHGLILRLSNSPLLTPIDILYMSALV